MKVGNVRGHECSRQQAQRKGKENRHSTESRERAGVQMPLLRRDGHPPAPGCEIPHIASEDEREQQRQKENRKKGYSQQSPSAPITNVGALHPHRKLSIAAAPCWLVVS